MCFSVALAILSTAVSAVGAVSAAQAAKNEALYNAQVQRNNAIIAQRNAADVKERGREAAEERGAHTRQVVGAAKAAMASNGLLVDDGPGTSSQSLLDDLARAGAVDTKRLYERAQREEYRALVQGMNFEAQAGLFELQASNINPALAGLTAITRGLANNADILF
jgi:hypothetical protein